MALELTPAANERPAVQRALPVACTAATVAPRIGSFFKVYPHQYLLMERVSGGRGRPRFCP